MTVPLPEPLPPSGGPPAPAPPPAQAEYEFWIAKTPQNKWCATLSLQRQLGSRPVWRRVHRILTPGKDWNFSNVTRLDGSKGLPWISAWEVPSPSGGKWLFRIDNFMGLMQLPETQNPAPEELEAFSRFEGSWQTIANQLAATAPAPPGPSLPPGKKQFLRVREVLVDSDGDGILDVDELESVHPTNPLNPDSDGDGAYDGETPAASDPAAADEDKDGIPDAEDAVPYDKDITWPRLNLRYTWAPAGNSWLPVSLSSKGQALCVKQDGTTWKAALMTDGAVSSIEVVFRDTATSANPNTDIRYMLRPIALSDEESALFGDGTVYFPQRRYNFTSGATEVYPGNAALSAVWLPQATSLTRVLPPDQTTELAAMIGRQNSTLLGSQTPQNILAIQRCKASLMDGGGRLYAGLRDEVNWPYLAGSNFTGAPGNY